MNWDPAKPLEIRSLFIPGQLPGLNEIIDACATRKGKWNAYMSMKERWGNVVATHARGQNFPAITEGHFTYLIEEPNRRRDPSNVIAGVMKLVEDGLQEADLLPNDGWANVLSIRPYFICIESSAAARVCGVSLMVTRDEPLTFEQAAYQHSINRRKRYPQGHLARAYG